MHMRSQLNPGTHLTTTSVRTSTPYGVLERLLHFARTTLTARVATMGTVLLALGATVSAPVTAHAAAKISGTIFEDMNYAGGAGRSYANASGALPVTAAHRVVRCGHGSVLQGDGHEQSGRIHGERPECGSIYRPRGLQLGDQWPYRLSRGLASAVPTFRTQLVNGVTSGITNEVGGHVPGMPDAGQANGNNFLDPVTWQFTVGPVGYAQAATIVDVPNANANITGIDFGFSFDVVSNINSAGMGSLSQAITNANGLANLGLAQSGLTPDLEHLVWMIPNGTNAPGLRASYDAFTAGVASIALDSPLPPIQNALVLDAQTQPGWQQNPIVQLDGSNAGVGANGLEILAPGCTIKGLILGGFDGAGLSISDLDCTVMGNWIGLDATGTGALMNHGDGIQVWADNAILGGSTPAERNVISGNGGDGVRIEFTSTGSTVKGNWIGPDANGTGFIGNGSLITPSAGLEANGDNLILGGTTPEEGNVISGNNGDGVRLSGFANQLLGNRIGVDATGAPMANGGAGVVVTPDFGGSNCEIGGTADGAGNTIANNTGNGVELDPLAGEGVQILGNVFADNGGLGIDLGADGLDLNDPLDVDGGPNSHQNFPVLSLALTSSQDLHVQGTLSSEVSTPYLIQLFASATSDPSGFGEGQRFLGSVVTMTDVTGEAFFDTTLTCDVAIGEVITATATTLDFNNTSEFSEGLAAAEAQGIDVGPLTDLATSEAGDSAMFTVVLEYRPSADVVIPVTSLNPDEAMPAVSSLTFTPSNWDQPQDVWVRGVDDAVMDGDQPFTISLEASSSSDSHYSGRDADDVTGSNADNDVAGITVTPTGGLATTEAGDTTSFTVQLTSEPTADVVIPVSSNTPSEGVASVDSLTFTAADWNVPQTVTLTGTDDSVVDGDVPYTIVLGPAQSADPNYDAMDADDVFANNADNDAAGVDLDAVDRAGHHGGRWHRHGQRPSQGAAVGRRDLHAHEQQPRRRHRRAHEHHFHARGLERGADRHADRCQ
jgi:hypothetical protein